MSDSKPIRDGKLDYSMDPCSDTESTMNLGTYELKEERNFSKCMSRLPHGEFDNQSSTFQEKYLSLTEDDDFTPLHIACTRGDLEQVTLLCDASNIDTSDKYNFRPIHVACICGHLRVVEYLHRHGCDIEYRENFGTKPLHLTAKHGWLDLAKYLCSQQCEVDVPVENLWRPIHLACRFGHTEIVKYLCDHGGSKDVITDREEQPLHMACKHGYLDIVKFLCERNCDIEATSSDDNRPIHFACKHGHLDIVKFLFDHNCDIEAATSNGDRPIHLACEHGHLEIVRFLCQWYSDIEAKTSDDNRPIHVACKLGHLDIVTFLCQQDCEMEAVTLMNERPIHVACKHGHLEIVRYLWQQSCNIEATLLNNDRLIHLACQSGYLEIVRFLSEQNCDIEARTSDDNRPIHVACKDGHLEIVKFICDRNCDIEAKALDDNRPIHVACKHGHLDIVKFLCDRNCDIDAPTSDNNRPIHFACKDGHLEIVKFLCDRNCDIEAMALDDNRPIHVACKDGHLEIVKFLCDRHCDIEAKASNNNRPIHFACKFGHLEIVKFLCQQKCEIEATALNNDKPIHIACRDGHLEIVMFLCEKNCDIEVTTLDNYRPIQLARKHGHNAIVKYLSARKIPIKHSNTYRTREALTKIENSVLPDQSATRQLVQKISNMKVECDAACDHSSCFESIPSNKCIIGMGAFGDVYRVTDPQLNYTYCMKSIYLDPNTSNQQPKHIEANIEKYLHLLYHERIVQYFGIKTKPEKIFIFMEYVEGIPLDKHIYKKPLPHNKVIQYSKEILEGLKFLHQNKIIHRDIKPANIMLRYDEHVKICDFGLSRYLESIGLGSEILTADSSSMMTFCGTPNYMASEIVTGKKYSYPVDIWALGVSVVEMLTGENPFSRIGNIFSILILIQRSEIKFVPAEPMSEHMKSFVDQMLCASPLTRATAEQLLEFIDKEFSNGNILTDSFTQNDDVSPLHKACVCGDLKLVELLWDTSNIEIRDKNNNHPIHSACIFGHLRVVEYLHRHGCDIEAAGNFGSRPLHLAAKHGRLNVVKYLCSHHCELDTPLTNLWRPIHLACKIGHTEIVKHLCKQKCSIEVLTNREERPLHIACEHGHIDIVRFLCERNCDIEASRIDNYRPLHVACMYGHLDIVRFFCEQNCNTEATTSDNLKPIQLARQYGHNDIVNYLSKRNNNSNDSDTYRTMDTRYPVLQRCDVETLTKNEIFVPPGESAERQLVQKIRDMKVECDERCDHSSCLQSSHFTKTFIGKGHFGTVYKMTDPHRNYTCCMKSIYLKPNAINPKPKHIEPNIEKYRHLLYHERIVQYFAMKTNDQEMFIFMEYVEGISLDKYINDKPLPHNKVIQYSKEILEGLKFLHQNKIIHRDIKPPNIMLNAEEHVKLCDFGVSCYLESIGLGSEIQTADSSSKMTTCGTPTYMAPELVNGEKYSYPVDIWALGASVVEMLTGRPPFHGMSYCTMVNKIGTDKKIEFDPAEPMSEDMKSFVDQMLCPCPLKRATAQTLLEFISHAFSV